MTTPTNNQPVKKSWDDQKIQLKKTFPTITDQDLHFEEGKKGEMFTKLQTKLGKTKEEMQTAMAAL